MWNVLRVNLSSLSTCNTCTLWKQERSSHSGTLPHSQKPGYRFYCALAGPSPVHTPGGHLYAMVLLYDASRWNWVMLSKFKSQTFDAFKRFPLYAIQQTWILLSLSPIVMEISLSLSLRKTWVLMVSFMRWGLLKFQNKIWLWRGSWEP